MKYLYGAAVQGIQGYIFQTNKLREIVGASELVENICTGFFKELFENGKFKEENLILSAAGNIKYIFEDYDICQEIVFKFPFETSKIAPGVSISQAVVKFDQGELNTALNKLEEKLNEQRNRINIPVEGGYMGVERVRRTGGLAFATIQLHNKNIIIDIATDRKIKESNSTTLFNKISNNLQVDNNKDLWTDIDRLFHNDNKSWIAIIHADGNGLGTIIQALSANLKSKSDQDVKDAYKSFSKALDNSTKHAAQIAFKEVVLPNKTKDLPYPIRPIILGGDDLTMIIRADLALDFTITYLKEFEKATTSELSFLREKYGIKGYENGISACAGISYVKKSYPFHYGVTLADKLCVEAKKFVKEIVGYDGLVPQSALSFFKIQDSFVEPDLLSIKKRSLEARNLSFDYGPYLIGNKPKGHAHIDDLLEKIVIVERWANNDNNQANGISKLRQWVAESFKDESTANFMLERMKTINKQFFESMGKIVTNDEMSNKNKSMIYDVIQLTSLK